MSRTLISMYEETNSFIANASHQETDKATFEQRLRFTSLHEDYDGWLHLAKAGAQPHGGVVVHLKDIKTSHHEISATGWRIFVSSCVTLARMKRDENGI